MLYIHYDPQKGWKRHTVGGSSLKCVLLLRMPARRHYHQKLAAISNGRPLSRLQLFRHVCWSVLSAVTSLNFISNNLCNCRVPDCGFHNRSPVMVHRHYANEHPEYDYVGSEKKMVKRDAAFKTKMAARSEAAKAKRAEEAEGGGEGPATRPPPRLEARRRRAPSRWCWCCWCWTVLHCTGETGARKHRCRAAAPTATSEFPVVRPGLLLRPKVRGKKDETDINVEMVKPAMQLVEEAVAMERRAAVEQEKVRAMERALAEQKVKAAEMEQAARGRREELACRLGGR